MNGVVERKFVTDRDRGLAMHFGASLTEEARHLLRAEAESTAEKISNIYKIAMIAIPAGAGANVGKPFAGYISLSSSSAPTFGPSLSLRTGSSGSSEPTIGPSL
jgi:hypothetical protein